MRILLPLAVLMALVAGCGQENTPEVARETTTAGSMAPVVTRSLECDHQPYRTSRAVDYDDGLTEVQDSPADALDNWLDAEAWAAEVPTSGYVVEWERAGQALLSWNVDGRTRIAVLVADGITDYLGNTGWGVQSWAQCNPAELPAEVTDRLDVGVWENASAQRVPTTEVVSFQGAEHCDWQDLTWLRLGVASDADRTYDEYLSGDDDGQLADYLTTAPAAAATLPADAVDTGWRRDGRELWLGESPRAAYLVSLDVESDVQLWPATKESIGCE